MPYIEVESRKILIFGIGENSRLLENFGKVGQAAYYLNQFIRSGNSHSAWRICLLGHLIT